VASGDAAALASGELAPLAVPFVPFVFCPADAAAVDAAAGERAVPALAPPRACETSWLPTLILRTMSADARWWLCGCGFDSSGAATGSTIVHAPTKDEYPELRLWVGEGAAGE
jgi:hypothetical protein